MIYEDDPNKVRKITNLFGKSEPLVEDLPSMEKKIEMFALASISATTVIFTGGKIDRKVSK